MIWKGQNILKIDYHFDRENHLKKTSTSIVISYWLTCLLSLSRGLMLIIFVTILSHMIHIQQHEKGVLEMSLLC